MPQDIGRYQQKQIIPGKYVQDIASAICSSEGKEYEREEGCPMTPDDFAYQEYLRDEALDRIQRKIDGLSPLLKVKVDDGLITLSTLEPITMIADDLRNLADLAEEYTEEQTK
jgi:hypothetical protein